MTDDDLITLVREQRSNVHMDTPVEQIVGRGLQSTLRADGVPASVTFFGHEPRACQRYPKMSAILMAEVFGGHGPPLVIHSKALPHDAGIQLSPLHHAHGAPIALAAGLVRATPGCTGT